MPEVSNPAGPAGGIPDGLSGAFDKAISDLGLDEELDAGGEDVAVPEAEGEPEAEAPVEAEAKPDVPPPRTAPRQEQPRVAKPAPRQQPAAEPVEAPEGLPEEHAEAFAKLPAEAQTFVRDLQSQHNERVNAFIPWANYGRQVRALITDENRANMERAGFKSEIEGIAHLIQLNEVATKDFPRYARWALGQYGNGDPVAAMRAIFPEVFGEAEPDEEGYVQPQPRQAAPDPVQRQVLDTLGNVVRRLDGYDEATKAQRLQAADQVIASFRVEKDASGLPKYPYLKEVERHVARIVRQPEYKAIADLRERLVAAYDAAVALVPSVRKKAFAAERSKWEKEQAKKTEVERARKARSVVSSPTTGATGTQTKGLDAAINQAMSELGV